MLRNWAVFVSIVSFASRGICTETLGETTSLTQGLNVLRKGNKWNAQDSNLAHRLLSVNSATELTGNK